MCGARTLGTMDINEYAAVEVAAVPASSSLGGVRIKGEFTTAAPALTFHYLQAILIDDAPFLFTDGSAFTAPYVDTPPGGYQGQPFDLKPYYDQPGDNPAFPGFFDEPKLRLNRARDANQTGPDGKINVDFETWLVCVVKETMGATANRAKDDMYFVAPLVGWTWGFNIALTDNGNADMNELADYDTKANPFAFIPAPSASWQFALEKVYSIGTANEDFFDILLRDCSACVPEPGAISLAGVGVLALWMRRRGA
jgi:hypothetical protein